MTEPPLLTGDEAKLTTTMRELTGEMTDADYKLWKWIALEYWPLVATKLEYPISAKGTVVLYRGEQIWPPK